jgi:cyclophilin family peptidyl-prolyl cis-trans isomerase
MTEIPRLIEPLESRIAPAIVIANPIFDVTATTGKTGVSLDLGKLVDVSKSYRTVVEFVTNFTLPGDTNPAVIQMELFDDKAPITVANFLRYLNNANKNADYDGVIFHRLVQGFVLQGGGNNATNRDLHIDTFATIHNEFDPNDPERSNLVQTVAMAKVAAESGGGAHSATSEFFINLGDNSANLDAQNGGFTVFGRVTDASMPVVNALGQLQLFNNAVPVQNYSGGLPTPAQLITITDARVVSSSPGDDGGATFTVSVTDEGGVNPTKLVTAKLNPVTNQLDLKYTPGMNGVAKVTVTVSKPGEIDVTDEFLVTVKANLITEVSADGLKSTFVPGDKGVAKVLVTNNGGAVAKGKVNVKLYLSESNVTQSGDGDGFALDQDPVTGDRLLATLNGVNINIQPGKSATIPVKYTVNNLDSVDGEILIDGKSYRLLAIVEPAAGSTVQELFGDDNVGNFRLDTESLTSPAVLRTFDLAFGEVGGRGGVPITVQDVNNDNLTLMLTGPGTGTVVKNADGTLDVSLSGTTLASKLRVVTARGVIADLDDLFINDTIGSVALGNVHLHGHFTASDGAKSIVFGDLGNTDDAHPENNFDKTLSIGAFPIATQKLSLNLGKVRDYTLQSDMPISTLLAKEWLDDSINTATNAIGAPSIGVMKIGGDFEANMNLAGTSKLSLLSVTGAMRGVTVKIGGDVGVVQLGSLADSQFLVGLTVRPDEIGDFVTAKTISNFTVKGTMSNSVVAAAKMTVVNVAAVDANAGTELGGFYADAIKSYVRKGPVLVKKTNLDAAAVADSELPNYEVRVF